MSWYISFDKIDDGDALDNWNGAEATLEECRKNCTHKFRMLDDDDEIYYIGYSDDSSSFEPLDDFGLPNAGATNIQYLENGRWESL